MTEQYSTLESFGHHAPLKRVREETEARVRDFLTSNCLSYIIALSGDSESNGSIARRNEAILEEFIDSLHRSGGYGIQTGGTLGGIPEIGARVAKRYEMPVIAVRPESTRKYALPGFMIDLVVETPDQIHGRTTFGSETPTFVSIADGAVVIGGSFGTLIESSSILKINKSLVRDNKPPKYLCPIAGTGKTADLLYDLKIDPTFDALPDEPISTGMDAAAFMNQKLPTAKI